MSIIWAAISINMSRICDVTVHFIQILCTFSGDDFYLLLKTVTGFLDISVELKIPFDLVYEKSMYIIN